MERPNFSPTILDAVQVTMARRLNWKRAVVDSKPKLSLRDEQEFMERDVAAKWLQRQQQHIKTRQARLMKVQQQRKVQTGTTKRQSSGVLPWEGESAFCEE
jgi:hypothetical protein